MTAREMTPFDRSASEYLDERRRRMGDTVESVATRSGIPVVTLRRYLHGERSMSLGDFRSLAFALDVTTEGAVREIERRHAEAKPTS